MMAEQQKYVKNQYNCLWSLMLFFLWGSWIGIALLHVTDGDVVLLNDRAAQIVGAESLRGGLCDALQLDGSGQLIGLADNGLDQGDLNHLPLDLKTTPGSRAKIVALQSVMTHVTPSDPNGHGTHMAGTLVGNGAASGGKYCGIAPEASLYFQSLKNERGEISVPGDVSSLFQMAYDAGVRIHVDGWGETKNQYGTRTASIDRFVQANPDFLAIFSAGNGGMQIGSLTTEANSKNALVVGTSQSSRAALSADAVWTNQVSKTSSAGPTADGRIKPDLLAPASSVVSVASSLVKSNFTVDPQYTVMGGSSMAAAVTGGSCALLAQYLQQRYNIDQPSAALMKALFIQGARKTYLDREHYGFGILDMTTTVLSMEEHCMQWEDQMVALQQLEARDYYYKVEDPSQPLRVTLVWTDPVSSAGGNADQLVNNLDLQLIGPSGQTYYGNDFDENGTVDVVNNVEQIELTAPEVGVYTLRVAATGIQTGAGQAYAIAYGQNIASQAIQTVQKDQLVLESGEILGLQNKTVVCCQQGALKDTAEFEVGDQVYWVADKIYVVGSRWQEEGVQLLADDKGVLMTSMNRLARNGGYYIDQSWLRAQNGGLLYNEEVRAVEDIPDGVGVKAVINPVSQKLYQVWVEGVEVSGRVDHLDQEEGWLFLEGDGRPYQIASVTALYYTNTQVEGTPESRPFGYMQASSVEQLISGMQVRLLIEEKTRQVYVIEAERPTVFAQIDAVDSANQSLTLRSGQVYFLTPQTQMEHDGEKIDLAALQVGQWMAGVTREREDGTQELISVQVMDQIFWGRILYFGEASHTVYLLDQKNQFREFKLDEAGLIMRGRAQIRPDAVSEGSWVRVVLNEDSGKIERMDIATGVREEEEIVAEFYAEPQSIRFTDDAQYPVQDTTLFVREGKVVSAENVLKGEKVRVTVLPGNSRRDMYLARVEVQPNAGQNQMFTKLEAHYLEDKIILVGQSWGKTIQIYRADNSMQQIQTEASGAFAILLDQQEDETALVVSALDMSSGEVDIQKVEIEDFVPEVSQPAQGFTDIADSPYKQEILALKERGILTGYADGSFRPNEPITRMGLLSLLVQATGEVEVSLEGVEHFKDMQDIPWWGLSTVNTIWQRGWSHGFEDACVHPLEYVRSKDVQKLLLNCEGGKNLKLPPTQGGYITRAEAAGIVYQLVTLP